MSDRSGFRLSFVGHVLFASVFASAVFGAGCGGPSYVPPAPILPEEDAGQTPGDDASPPDRWTIPDLPPSPDLYMPPPVDAPPGCPGVACPPDAKPAPVCGNRVVEEGESCDDGNGAPADGCSGICRVEPFYECPLPGTPCTRTIMCGNGKKEGNEACDDGNTIAGDCCAADCLSVEPGCSCTPTACTPMMGETPVCGDSKVGSGENCDDGNKVVGDGCSDTCRSEGTQWTCPVPGMPCMLVEYCGDGRLNGTEDCDDDNSAPGDGCDGTCRFESPQLWDCSMPGKLCVTRIVCGDLKVVGDEACDDGNVTSMDGCAGDCKRVEGGWTCANTAGVGGPCTAVPMPICSDGRLDFGEYCDDGNKNSMDGCSSSCRVEAGYSCPVAGMMCTLVGWCGDGKVSTSDGEQCDDGNKVGTDGCSETCIIEEGFVCPTAGQPCTSTTVCNDGKVTGNETCDDTNRNGGDGCSATCQVEMGWTCPVGAVCRPTRCGDGMKVGGERCDDGNASNSDGCDSVCKLEGQDSLGNGWVCPTANAACVHTVCNDANKAGSEPCDDGNKVVGDGCTPYCQVEPTCPAAGGSCSSRCGDGLILPTDLEDCDDGNDLAGDGCSPTCKQEAGWACSNASGQPPTTLLIPVVYRDMIARPRNGSTRHPDFETFGGDDATLNLVENQLGLDGKPVFAGNCTEDEETTACPYGQQLTTKANFDQWYRDTAGVNISVVAQLPLVRQADGSYFYPNGAPNQQLYPLDGKGWVASNNENSSNGHNYGFTSEVRYWFQFAGGEVLKFSGDDDVWVFINKRLVLDLGGLHPRRERTVTLDTATANMLGLQVGRIYEFVLFHAERHTNASNFNLTLKSFASAKSVCVSVCGDGIVAGSEACDLGTAMNTGMYGTCNANCTLPARCGDAMVQTPPEQCDDGLNLTTYAGSAMKCAPGCVWAGRCGDSKVDGSHGEACDEGASNGQGYGHCSATCQLGPRCGDGAVTDQEECDPSAVQNPTVTTACSMDCKLKCGNGMPDAPEQCDDGKANNTGGYGKCNPDCSRGPRCGDGVKNGAEECDDGKNDGAYGRCGPGCLLGPRCGDGAVQSTGGEVCDLGAQNSTMAYGREKCTNRCRPAPYCGDGALNTNFGEACDDGLAGNTGNPGACKADCSGRVPNPSCGDGMKQANEQCDQGQANGTAASTCDATCRLKCGNGAPEPGEQCDLGAAQNTGAYGTCNPDCTLAGYCGDGKKNGFEACDLGAANEANGYGAGKCSTTCAVAPYCGDGRIDMSFGEQCDGPPYCTAACMKIIVE